MGNSIQYFQVSQGAIPRRRRMPGYDPAKEQNMIAAYTKEKQAVQSES